MNRIIAVLFVVLLFSVNGFSQKSAGDQLKIVFYNTENIYDTIDDPLISDEEFLPNSKIAWNTERLNTKLNNIARALISIDSTNLPGMIGLAEVENIGVLRDLINNTGMKRGKYEAILEEGNDQRGIDVALIYRKEALHCLGHWSIPSATSFKTRSVLYVKFANKGKDTLHIFVNHWKSRSGGSSETEPQRLENANVLKHLTDSVLSRNTGAKIIIMGDFNDEPNNKSLSEALNAMKPVKNAIPSGLYNLMYDRFLAGEGTLFYKDWDLFDQFIVSGNLLIGKRGKKPGIEPPYAFIFKPDFLLFKNKDGVMIPNRTASSKEYYGGFSDHLPVYVSLNY